MTKEPFNFIKDDLAKFKASQNFEMAASTDNSEGIWSMLNEPKTEKFGRIIKPVNRKFKNIISEPHLKIKKKKNQGMLPFF